MKLYNKVLKVISVLLVAVLVLGVLSSCNNNPTDTGEKAYSASKIRVNVTDAYGSGVLQIVKLKNILEDKLPEDVVLEWTSLNNSNDTRDALATNQIDVGSVTSTSAIVSLESEIPVVLLSSSVLHSGAMYSTNKDIQSIEDIIHANKVALNNLGGGWHLALMLKCRELFGNPKEIDEKLIAMKSSDMLVTVETSDTLDCIVMPFPYTLLSNKMDKLTQIYDLTQVLVENDIRTLLLTNNDFFNNNPYLIEILYEAFSEAINFMNESPDEAAQLLSDFYGNVEAPDIKDLLVAAPPRLEISESAYDNVASLMHEVGILQNPPKKFSELPNYNSIPKTP